MFALKGETICRADPQSGRILASSLREPLKDILMDSVDSEGLRAMRLEMARQSADALATLDEVGSAAEAAAASIRATGRVLLCGMGGSHHVNAIAAPFYRALGVSCHAMPASEVLLVPPPPEPRTLLIVSQSGRSGEIVELLSSASLQGERFALTLDGESPLARACSAALVAHGGPEHAFAATRSITLTLALHGAVLERLGSPQEALRRVFSAFAPPPIEIAAERLADCDAIVFAGYGPMAGVAHSAALSMMELARMVAIPFEGGQFRHGPFEALRPGLGVVLFRGAGADAPLIEPLARTAWEAGCSTVLVDASGRDQGADVPIIALPVATDLAAAAAMLLTMQPLNIAVAQRRIASGVGTPLRTSKVTV